MTTTARIRTSVAIICAVFALLIASGLAVRGQATGAGSASQPTAAVATTPVAVPTSFDEESESDGELD